MRATADIDGIRRLLRVGRDGKNRYCVYYMEWEPYSLRRCVVAGGLTKQFAYGMLKLLKG